MMHDLKRLGEDNARHPIKVIHLGCDDVHGQNDGMTFKHVTLEF